MITDINQLDLTKTYTYGDYLKWKFTERVELIRGKIFKMSPAPNTAHQRVSGNIYGLFWNFLNEKKCSVFNAPFDVTLPMINKKNKKQQTTVVQPDIVVVCDETKLDTQGCNGVPDLVVEILSPGNTKKEMKFKFEVYQEAKIPEYWLIDPQRQFMMCYSLNDEDIYVGSAPYTDEAIFESKSLKGFQLPLFKIFTDSKFD